MSLWQPAKVAGLLDEADAGLPGRFLFVPTTDPDAPGVRPRWPGPLDWTPPPMITSPNPLGYDDAIAAEVDTGIYARLRGEVIVDTLDAHRTLHRLKLSGLLAVLDGRRSVELDDWRIADELLHASDRLAPESSPPCGSTATARRRRRSTSTCAARSPPRWSLAPGPTVRYRRNIARWCAPGTIRTCDRRIRSPLLYPG